MSLYKVGRICMKIAGRDAGKQCVVLSPLQKQTVLVDGQTRRRKVNIKHLEPLEKSVEIKEDAPHSEVAKVFETLGLKVLETKPKKAAARPRKMRKVKAKTPEPVKKKKAAPKKEVKKEVTPKQESKPAEEITQKA